MGTAHRSGRAPVPRAPARRSTMRALHETARPANPEALRFAPTWTVSRSSDTDEVRADRSATEAMARLPMGRDGRELPSEEGAVSLTGPSSWAAAFGHDFSRVRVHVDATARELTRALGARAVTVGRQIFFAPGTYEPRTRRGQGLLAHELAHVVEHDEGGQQFRVRRQPAGCTSLLGNPSVTSLMSGTAVHQLIKDDFAGRVPGAVDIMIPGASAAPLRTGGICGRDDKVIPPQLLGGAAGAGFPDLARRNLAGVLSVAEIKPAAVECLVDGENQLMRYIDQGNARDPAQAAWRAGSGISVVVPMLPSLYQPPILTAGVVTIETAWCGPGLLVYAVRRGRRVPVEVPAPVPAEERERERQRLEREARTRGTAIAVGTAGAAAVTAVVGRALWRHFWQVVARRFAVRGAAALALAAADGPLPFGELIDVGLAVVTIVQIGIEWEELWRQADELAASGT
ncbi:eCIS core domain-containing protein [Geodermatophilus sp. SYSU D01105]